MDVDAILNKGKGQMFMIGAIFIVVGFVLLKGLLSLPILAQEKNFQDTSYLDRSLKNIRSEYQYASSIASMQGNANASAVYLYNISTYMRSEFD